MNNSTFEAKNKSNNLLIVSLNLLVSMLILMHKWMEHYSASAFLHFEIIRWFTNVQNIVKYVSYLA